MESTHVVASVNMLMARLDKVEKATNRPKKGKVYVVSSSGSSSTSSSSDTDSASDVESGADPDKLNSVFKNKG